MKMVKRILLYGIPKSLLIKIILALVIILIGKNVFAQQIDVTNKIRYSPDTSGGTYYGDEIYLGGYNGQFSVKTRYNGQLSQVEFYLKDSDYSFELNKTYTITLNMETSDWRNNFMGPLVYGANSDGSITSGSPNWYVSNTFSFVSMKKIKFNIKPTGTIKPLTKFTIYSTNVNSTAITGVNNWNLYSIIIDDNSSSSGSSGGSSTPTPTPNPTFDDTGIINNQNQNTQDIINNSDKNTSDIIENNNQNTQIVDGTLNSQCKNGPIILSDDYYMKDNYYLDENGNEVADSSAAISTYFVIKPNSLYTISSPGGLAGNTYSICLYDSNKNILAANSSRKCQSVNQYTNGIDSGPYAQYMRITIPKRWYANLAITGPICNNFTKESIDNASSAIGGAIQGGVSGIIDNQNSNTDKVTDSISDVNDSINNPNVDSGTGSDFFDSFHTDDNGGISAIVTKPLTIVNNLLSNNNSCSNLPLPEFMGVNNAYLPSGCILWNNAPSTAISLWNIFVCGFGAYFILKDLFKIIENLKNPDNDRVEVMDL